MTAISKRPVDARPIYRLKQTTAFLAAMETAQSDREIVDLVLAHSGRFGVNSVFAGIMPAAGQSKRQQLGHVLLSALPEEWIRRYFNEGYLRHDPTIRLVREQHSPFLWREIEPRLLQTDAARNVMNEASEFGLRDGFTVALRTLEGDAVGFSFAGERVDLSDSDKGRLVLVATFAVGRALRLREANQLPRPHSITPRERQALRLAADGLTDNDIAQSMEISHHGAAKHLRSAREKSKARNTTHAIAISMRLGLIF